MKKYVGTFIASVALLTALPLAANAADGKTDTDNGTDTQKTTTAQIELKQDETDKNIKLTQVPEIDFGANTNVTVSKKYDSTGTLADVRVHNPGNAEGWDVQVKRSAFTSDKGELKAAVLAFENGKVTPDDHTNASTLPKVSNIEVNEDTKSLLTAGAGEGVGAFSLKHNNADVTLTIPAGNVAGKYKSTLTWTLANAPTGTTPTTPTTPSK